MNTEKILHKAIELEALSLDEGMLIYEQVPTNELMLVANECRQKQVPGNQVGWIIDRNVNITNVCISGCQFCNFRYPDLKLHTLGPPEVAFLAKKERKSFRETLEILVKSGMDSLPGAGAEILSDRVRKILSPGKCNTQDWLDVMREAHKMNLVTSATMMFGHIETKAERLEHLIRLREVQSEKPEENYGFVTFVPWPFMDAGTVLQQRFCNVCALAVYGRRDRASAKRHSKHLNCQRLFAFGSC